MARNDHALTEPFGLLLIAFLIIVVALLITASLTGVIDEMLQKPALLTVTATQYDDGAGHHLIQLHHKQGNPVNINGSTHSGGVTEIMILVNDTTGTYRILNSGPMSAATWSPGQNLYIYSDGTVYRFSDTAPASAGVVSLAAGEQYTIQLIDMRPDILLHSLPVTIR
ncbi:MAG: hypothetical protein GYA23_01580 [Methanomicrobiales archaeon]|nr:hypothetical protein [Methanomicrobiales archaeon]